MSAPARPADVVEAARPATTQIHLVDKPGAAQSMIMVGGLGARRSDADYRALEVLNNALGGNFDALARQWGLPPEKAAEAKDDPVPDPDAPKWSGLDVGSPFDYATQATLYVETDLPDPNDAANHADNGVMGKRVKVRGEWKEITSPSFLVVSPAST